MIGKEIDYIYPSIQGYHDGNPRGLTKREYFAGLAMQSELAKDTDAHVSINDCEIFLGLEKGTYDWKKHYPIFLAKKCVMYADELLKQLNEKGESK